LLAPALAKYKPTSQEIDKSYPHPHHLHCFHPIPAPLTVSLKNTKNHATCFTTGGNLFSGLFQSQQKLLKTEVKMCRPK